jgi:hypothetical protein
LVIREIIQTLPKKLTGSWIKKNSSYETGLCAEMGWIKEDSRFYDATINNIKIEIKKGINIWLDLVRYSEILIGRGDKDTITTFFIPDKQRTKILRIIFVDTNEIIQKLKITMDDAEKILQMQNKMPRQLNAQANLTIKDVERIAFYIYELR